MSVENFESFLGNSDENDTSNERKTIKSKLTSIVSSMQVMDEERENIKEITKDLKEEHEISPKVAKAVAKIMKEPEKLQEFEEESRAIEELVKQITG